MRIRALRRSLRLLVFVGFRFSVFAISIPRLRTHAGAVAGSRLVHGDVYSVWFSSIAAANDRSMSLRRCHTLALN